MNMLRTMSRLLLMVLCLQVLALWPQKNLVAEETRLVMQEMSYKTRDNMTIFGSWIVPQASEKSSHNRPAVILLHDYGFNRREWGGFIPDLIEHGFNVLAFDLRGHGQSKEGGAPAIDYLMSVGVLDVEAALKWVASQKHTDKKRISLIGVGIGADIVFLCAGQLQKKIRSTVVISPTYSSIIEGDFVSTEPRSVLFCASVKSSNGMAMIAVETLSNFTEDPKKVVVYNSAAHGFTLFYKHPEIKQEILSWISR